MNQFNWEEFLDKNNKIAVHCKTEEEAKDFCKQMHEYGLKWDNSTNLYIERTNWHVLKEKTCYTNHGRYCDKDYYVENDYKILEWSDYMKKEFTKADLKDGMIVEQKNGERYVIYNGKELSLDGYNPLEQFRDDLTNELSKLYDIKKVYKLNTKEIYCLNDIFYDENLELIWERTKLKKMTAEKMRQKLEELTGEKIEVEPSMEEMIRTIKIYCDNCTNCDGCCIGEECRDKEVPFGKCDKETIKKCYKKVTKDE